MNLSDIKLTPLLDTLRLEKISDAVYFSEKYSGYVSNSRLGLLNPKQDGSPKKFFAGFSSVGYAPALEMGSAVHELVLQPDAFAVLIKNDCRQIIEIICIHRKCCLNQINYIQYFLNVM